MDNIVAETNRYARPHDKWTPLTTAELKGFCIFMGIVKLPSIENYWRRDVQFHYSPIASKISRDRFRDIRRYLHFTDNTTLPTPGTPGSDRLAKVRPFNKRCSAAYNLGREVAVDEAMIKFQGRSALKQYLPNKPVNKPVKRQLQWVLPHATSVYRERSHTREARVASQPR